MSVQKLLVCLLLWGSVCFGSVPKVVVSVLPQKSLIEKIAGECVEVVVLVPQGASPHTYEPTIKEMLAARQGEVWFRIGESFEGKLLSTFKGEIIDCREGLDLLSCGCCSHDDADTHLWMSPRLLLVQTEKMVEMLARLFPENAALFREKGELLKQELHELDREFVALFGGKKTSILVSHAAFGYFCRDYGLTQLSIEKEGREPTPRQIHSLLSEAKEKNISTIFVQPQYSSKGAKRIASELGAEVVVLDPYAEEVLDNLKTIAHAFSLACPS